MILFGAKANKLLFIVKDMIEANLYNHIKISNGESAKILPFGFIIAVKSITRIRPPKLPDQFILILQLTQGTKTQEFNIDGEFRFPSESISIEWKNFKIRVQDLDYMASFVIIIVEDRSI
jgi:hypothetical protein